MMMKCQFNISLIYISYKFYIRKPIPIRVELIHGHEGGIIEPRRSNNNIPNILCLLILPEVDVVMIMIWLCGVYLQLPCNRAALNGNRNPL